MHDWTKRGVAVERIKAELRSLLERWPADSYNKDVAGYAERGRIAVVEILAGRKSSTQPLTEVWVNCEQAYLLGMASLALRAEAVREAGKSFRSFYQKSSALYGFDVFHARIRRRSMYFPILAEDEGFHHLISEISRQDYLFPIVKVTDKVKDMRIIYDAIDWLPFGGPP